MLYVTPFYTNMDLLGLDLYLCCIKLLIYILVITASRLKKKTNTKIQALCWTEICFSRRRDFVVYGNFLVQLVSSFFFFHLFWVFFLFAVTFVIYFFVCKTPIKYIPVKSILHYLKKKRNKLTLMKSGCAI